MAAEALAAPQPQTVVTAPDWKMSVSDWCAVVGASLGAFMAVLDIQITNASLKDIQGALGLDLGESGWISTAYLVAEIIIIPLTAFLSRVLGLRRFMGVSAIGFIISSVLCGFSWDIHSLVVFRIFQGLTGGTLIPASFQVILLYMPRERRTLGMAILGLTTTLAPTLGPSLGGWMTETLGWRSVFFMNILPGILLTGLILYGLPKTRIKWSELAGIDILSIVCLILGLGSLSYLLEEGAGHNWFSDDTLRICFLTCIIFLPLFVVRQFAKLGSLLNLNLLLRRDFLIATVITALSAACLYGGIYALSLYLAEIQNYSAMQIGLVMMWVGLPQLIVMPLIPLFMKKINLKLLIVVGLCFFCYSNYLNSFLTQEYSGEQFRISLIFRAIGQPLFMIPLSVLGMSSLLASEAGSASAIFNVMRNLGGSIGIATVGTLLLTRQEFHSHNDVELLLMRDTSTNEQITILTKHFVSKGADLYTAKAQAVVYLLEWVQKQATIQAFCDIFKIMYIGLFVAAILVVFLSKSKKAGGLDASGMMH